MCDPFTIAALASTAFSVGKTVIDGRNQKKAIEGEAAAQRNAANLAEENSRKEYRDTLRKGVGSQNRAEVSNVVGNSIRKSGEQDLYGGLRALTGR